MYHYHKGKQGKINLATLILIILIFYVLFKVDIKSAIENEDFQKNKNYIEELVINLKNKYFSNKKIEKINNLFNNSIGNNFQNSVFNNPQNINLIPRLDPPNFEQNFDLNNTSQINDYSINNTYDLPYMMNTSNKEIENASQISS